MLMALPQVNNGHVQLTGFLFTMYTKLW